MIKIYHNNRCSKSRAGLKFLEEGNYKIEVVNYLNDTPFTFESLKSLILKTGMKPQELVRKHEDIYKKQFKGKNLTDDEWLSALVKYPKLLHRPIIENGERAVWAQPPEKANEVL